MIEVGDPVQDHECWIRPENMKTPRNVLQIDKNAPGTEIAAETSAALAAASIVFRGVDHTYARRLLNKAKTVFFSSISILESWLSCSMASVYIITTTFLLQLFHFAKTYKGTYDGECPFYCSFSGYNVISPSP